MRLTSKVASWVRLAKERTSSATTAKPRPLSPARAASIAAFKANKLVCSAIEEIISNTWPTSWLWLSSSLMTLEAWFKSWVSWWIPEILVLVSVRLELASWSAWLEVCDVFCA